MILTMVKEAIDDFKRYQRDREANSFRYETLRQNQFVEVPASELKPGDLIKVNMKQRIPADLLLIACNDPTGNVFVRTD